MKICIFTHTFPRFPGDTAAPFMGNLAEALAGLGHRVFVLSPYDARIRQNTKRPYSLVTYRYIFPDSLHRLGYSRTLKGDKSMSLGSYLLSPFLYFFGFLALLRLVRQEKIDVVSSHWIIPNGFIAALVKLLTGVPFTTTIPGSDIYLAGKNILFRLMVAFAAYRASFVLSDNAAYMSELLALGITPRRRKIIVYGADTAKFVPRKKDKKILQKLGLDDKAPVMLAVGRMVAKKGFVYLIEAMPRVLKTIPDAKLVLVGDGDERKKLEKRIRELEIRDSVIFAGTIPYDRLSKYYNFADVFVMPSIRDEEGNIDASPVAMMEAMACGTPIVATSFSGSKDLVIPGKTGFLVREKDAESISNAVIKLLSVGRSSMQKNVRKMAVENFSTNSIAKKYTEIFTLAKE